MRIGIRDMIAGTNINGLAGAALRGLRQIGRRVDHDETCDPYERAPLTREEMNTLFKYIRASYGLGDVVIGEIESVKLYLTCQKFIYGKNVTM